MVPFRTAHSIQPMTSISGRKSDYDDLSTPTPPDIWALSEATIFFSEVARA
jgi:hypothetical protein